MKTNYFYSLILGIMCLISNISLSQNILFDGDFSTTTEIIAFDSPTPPLNTWASFLNSANGVEANPIVVDGVCNYQITNPGSNTWEVQLAQWGFPLIQRHLYQLMFDVRADADRNFGVFLGEDGGNYTSLIGLDRYFYYATTDWQTISIDFEATSVFELHKLSFELGGNSTTTYFDNVILQDLGPAPPKKIVIAGTFQSALNCGFDWDPNCDFTELSLNSSTGLYTGTFQIPEGKQRYKVTVGGSWDISYGENGILNGPDIFLCLPSGSEEITFTYDPSTNLVTTSPIASGFSPDCLPMVVLAGSFQDELGCYTDWVGDCLDTALIYNSDSGLFEADFNIPTGCYDYRVVLENSWENSFGQDGIHYGPNYSISIPADPDITHFTYDPVSHIVNSTPYSGAPEYVTKVSLFGTLQDEFGCYFDYNYECDTPALLFNPDSGAWEGRFILPAGCYSYLVKETVGCYNFFLYGENGIELGNEIQLYVPSDAEITFSYDAQTHILTSTPYNGVPQEIAKVSLFGTLQDELGCTYDGEYDCDKPELILNSETGAWEGSFMLPAGCYNYLVKETFGCNNVILYGEDGIESGNEIQLYVPSDAEITFTYNPQTHIITSTPYSGAPQDVIKVWLYGTLQNELGCDYDFNYECESPALQFNSISDSWEGNFTLPAGCYTYRIVEKDFCDNLTSYGDGGIQWGNEIQLYVPKEGEITFSYDTETHFISSTPYSGAPEEVTKVSLYGSLQDELGCSYDYDFECDNPVFSFNSISNLWEASFSLPAGCYIYLLKETFGCNTVTFYGENGTEGGNEIQLYVPSDAEITFSYDPQTHIVTSTPYSGAPQEVIKVSLIGTLQDELGCDYDYNSECDDPALQFNSISGSWEGSFMLPAGCYTYRVKETFGCNNVTLYGENGTEWGEEIQLVVPSDGDITFSHDPQTHIITSTPYNSGPLEVTKVSLIGTLQDELGCTNDQDYECDNPALLFNSGSGAWEGSFTLPAGCYIYQVKETFGCNYVALYGENGIEWGQFIQLYVPLNTEISFSYDPQTHIVTSTPYSGAPQEVTKVSLTGSLQYELGCAYDGENECEIPALLFNSDTDTWEGSFNLPAGCYNYWVKETFGCNNVSYYGENGIEWGNEIQLYVPSDGEITFSYDPQTHIVTSSPDSVVPQELTTVSLQGTLQNELGCGSDYDYPCDHPALIFNPDSGTWGGSFTLPAGCYTYIVKETFGCNNISFYGENGIEWGNELQLYVPIDAEITFSYDPQTHIITSTPYSGAPEEVTIVSLFGSLQDELGCAYDYEGDCDNSTLRFNSNSGLWTESFVLPAGCYTYRVKETFGCNNVIFYGENGIDGGNQIQLYVPLDTEITFSYDPQTHIVTSTPYSGAELSITKISLIGTLQDELGCPYDYDPYCDNSNLMKNEISGKWEGSFTLPYGCYSFRIQQTDICDNIIFYGENGIEWGNDIQLYIPSDAEITFTYDPQTHIISSTPYSGVPQEVTKVSLIGSLQDELGCGSDYEYECDFPALLFNPESGNWEGSFTLPVGCYTYIVKETSVCNYVTLFGENGSEWGNDIQLYVPSDAEIMFSYDPQTHIINSSPYSGAPQELTKVSLIGSLQDELGCGSDYDYGCDFPLLSFNPDSGNWEGSFNLPTGCYTYIVKETSACDNVTLFGENGEAGGDEIQLKIPLAGEITFSYNPQTHIITSTPYSGAPQEVTKVSLTGSLQDESGCASDDDYTCDKPALVLNADSGMWEGSFTIPAGCYFYWVKETIGCNKTNFYGENGEIYGNYIPLYVPFESEFTFKYDPQTHIISLTPYFDISTVNQCPENILVNNSPGTCGAIVDYPEFVETVYCGGEITSIIQTEGLPSGSFFPVGTTTNSFVLTKTTGEEITCSFDVLVMDTESPVISDLNQIYEPLSPANHKMVPVFIDYLASDNCNIASTELFISSNEPENGFGDGDKEPDWEIQDEHNVLLRAERNGKGDGREYYITIKVMDDSGNSTEESVTVKVLHDKGTETSNNNFILYPNGADDIINLKGPKSSSNHPYVIYDIIGVIRKQGTINNDQIQVGSLPSGVYILKFEMDKEYIFKKFIKN